MAQSDIIKYLKKYNKKKFTHNHIKKKLKLNCCFKQLKQLYKFGLIKKKTVISKSGHEVELYWIE